MKHKTILELAIAIVIGLILLSAKYVLTGPPRTPVEKRPVKSLQQTLPPRSHWYVAACGKGECDD